jgi:hypothetical protein
MLERGSAGAIQNTVDELHEDPAQPTEPESALSVAIEPEDNFSDHAAGQAY